MKLKPKKIYQIEVYADAEGNRPYSEWYHAQEKEVRAGIAGRIIRLEMTGQGDVKKLKGANGVHELRHHEGPGYRVYFGIHAGKIVLLLTGGIKRDQEADILEAISLWKDWKARQ